MENYLISFLLFIVPFIIFPFGHSQFELPKVILTELGIDVLIIFVIIKRGIEILKKCNRMQLSLTGAIILLTLYQLLALQTPFILFGDPTRLQGILLLWHLLIFAFITSRISCKNLPYYWYAIMLFVLLVLSFFIGNQNGRAVATLGEPNALAAFVIFLWPFLFFADIKNKNYFLAARVFSIVSTVIIIFLSGSRSGFLAFYMQLLFFLFISIGKHKLKTAIFTTVIAITLSLSLPFFNTTLYENRADIWKTAVAAGWQHPIFGGGFGNMEIILNRSTHELHNTLIGYSIDSAHNIFLDWWVQGGMMGLIFLLMIIFLSVKNMYQKKKIFDLLIFFGLITTLSFNPASVVNLLGIWWIIGKGFGK